MAAWTKCTDKDGGDIWINLDGATRMFLVSNELTRVCFAGDENEYEDVKEAPERLVGLAEYKKHIAGVKYEDITVSPPRPK